MNIETMAKIIATEASKDKDVEYLALAYLNEAYNNGVDVINNDIPFHNTKEGMHLKARQLNLKAYNLGCSCDDCNNEFSKMLNSSVGNQENVYEREVWNKAIDAAAGLSDNNVKDSAIGFGDKIRSLKK